MASLNKRSWTNRDGQVVSAWRVTYVDQSGKTRTKQFKKRADASKFRDTVSGSVADGTHVHDRDSMTVAEAAKAWLRACEKGRDGRRAVEAHTLRVYKGHVDNHIVPRIGGMLVSKVRKVHVKILRDDMLDDGASRVQVKKVLGSLHAIFDAAIDNEAAAHNPVKKVAIVVVDRSTAEEETRVNIPQREDVRRLVDIARRWTESPPKIVVRGHVTDNARFTHARARNLYMLLRTKIATGMRISELLGLPKANLDLKTATISVKQRASESGVIGPPKSVAGYRTIELPADLVAELREWLVQRPKGELDLVFPNASGGAERYNNFHRRFWAVLMIEAGRGRMVKGEGGKSTFESDFTLHDLRHFHASQYIALGANALDVKGRMGHSSIQVTYDIYGHLFQDDLAKATRRAHAETMSAMIFGS